MNCSTSQSRTCGFGFIFLIGRKYGYYTIISTISSNSMHILYDILLANRQYTNQKGCYGE
nr:MAG TPA: hypothetical protein [Bacteriophage sp.]